MRIVKKDEDGFPKFTLEDLTLGKLLAIKKALQETNSVVGADVAGLIDRAIENTNPSFSSPNEKIFY